MMTIDPETGSGTLSVVTGDFDRDGRADIVVGHELSQELLLFRGMGDGGFFESWGVVSELNPVQLVAADLDGNGTLDLAAADTGAMFGINQNLSVFLNPGDGGTPGRADYDTRNAPTAVAAADVDGDGIVDLLVTNNGSSDLSVFRGLGGGAFAPALLYATGLAPVGVVTGDWNGDGRLDVAVVDNGVSLLFNRGNLCAR
jgi:hypothetical protein